MDSLDSVVPSSKSGDYQLLTHSLLYGYVEPLAGRALDGSPYSGVRLQRKGKYRFHIVNN